MHSINPYKFRSDDILFQAFANKNDLIKSENREAREQFFTKDQPSLRASPLTNPYGWGVHYDKYGKMAIYGADSTECKKISKDKTLKVIKAMRSCR